MWSSNALRVGFGLLILRISIDCRGRWCTGCSLRLWGMLTSRVSRWTRRWLGRSLAGTRSKRRAIRRVGCIGSRIDGYWTGSVGEVACGCCCQGSELRTTATSTWSSPVWKLQDTATSDTPSRELEVLPAPPEIHKYAARTHISLTTQYRHFVARQGDYRLYPGDRSR